jgi:hypothetical protein
MDAFEKILANKLLKYVDKGVFKQNAPWEILKGALYEAFEEMGQEYIQIWGEREYLTDDPYVDSEQAWKRIKLSGQYGFVLGLSANAVLNSDNKAKKEYAEMLNGMLENQGVEVDQNGNINIKQEVYETLSEKQKMYVDQIKEQERFKLETLAKKYPDVPLEQALHMEILSQNPNFKDIEITHTKEDGEVVVDSEYLNDKGYSDEVLSSSIWEKARVKKGETEYEEGKKKYKTKIAGYNILDGPTRKIVLNSGSTQDALVEEATEILYKKLDKINPQLKGKIDLWIATSNIGYTDIEAFSKAFTFYHLGYNKKHTKIEGEVNLPADIILEFTKLLGQQEGGQDLGFIFNKDIVQESKQEENLETEKAENENIMPTTEVDEYLADKEIPAFKRKQVALSEGKVVPGLTTEEEIGKRKPNRKKTKSIVDKKEKDIAKAKERAEKRNKRKTKRKKAVKKVSDPIKKVIVNLEKMEKNLKEIIDETGKKIKDRRKVKADRRVEAQKKRKGKKERRKGKPGPDFRKDQRRKEDQDPYKKIEGQKVATKEEWDARGKEGVMLRDNNKHYWTAWVNGYNKDGVEFGFIQTSGHATKEDALAHLDYEKYKLHTNHKIKLLNEKKKKKKQEKVKRKVDKQKRKSTRQKNRKKAKAKIKEEQATLDFSGKGIKTDVMNIPKNEAPKFNKPIVGAKIKVQGKGKGKGKKGVEYNGTITEELGNGLVAITYESKNNRWDDVVDVNTIEFTRLGKKTRYQEDLDTIKDPEKKKQVRKDAKKTDDIIEAKINNIYKIGVEEAGFRSPIVEEMIEVHDMYQAGTNPKEANRRIINEYHPDPEVRESDLSKPTDRAKFKDKIEEWLDDPNRTYYEEDISDLFNFQMLPSQARALAEGLYKRKKIGSPQPIFLPRSMQVVYSNIITGKKDPETIKAQSIVNFFKKNGVKDEELKWLGLDEWIKDNYKPDDKVPFTELQQFVSHNEINVRMEETLKDDDDTSSEPQTIKKYSVRTWGEDTLNENPEKQDELEQYEGYSLHEAEEIAKEDAKYYAEEKWREIDEEGDDSDYVLEKNYDGTWNIDSVEYRNQKKTRMPFIRNSVDPETDFIDEYTEKLFNDGEIEVYSFDYNNPNYDEGFVTRHREYQLPDANDNKGYKELLMSFQPDKGSWDHSVHWDEENVLAWLRFNTRYIDGKKILFIEETQSDWMHYGDKKGFEGEGQDYKMDIYKLMNKYGFEYSIKNGDILGRKTNVFDWDNIQIITEGDIHTIEEKIPRTWDEDDPRFVTHFKGVGPKGLERAENILLKRDDTFDGENLLYRKYPTAIEDDIDNLRHHINEKFFLSLPIEDSSGKLVSREDYKTDLDLIKEIQLEYRNSTERVPNAPYKGFDWINLMIKRALRFATDNDYEGISWLNGNQSAQRWGALQYAKGGLLVENKEDGYMIHPLQKFAKQDAYRQKGKFYKDGDGKDGIESNFGVYSRLIKQGKGTKIKLKYKVEQTEWANKTGSPISNDFIKTKKKGIEQSKDGKWIMLEKDGAVRFYHRADKLPDNYEAVPIKAMVKSGGWKITDSGGSSGISAENFKFSTSDYWEKRYDIIAYGDGMQDKSADLSMDDDFVNWLHDKKTDLTWSGKYSDKASINPDANFKTNPDVVNELAKYLNEYSSQKTYTMIKPANDEGIPFGGHFHKKIYDIEFMKRINKILKKYNTPSFKKIKVEPSFPQMKNAVGEIKYLSGDWFEGDFKEIKNPKPNDLITAISYNFKDDNIKKKFPSDYRIRTNSYKSDGTQISKTEDPIKFKDLGKEIERLVVDDVRRLTKNFSNTDLDDYQDVVFFNEKVKEDYKGTPQLNFQLIPVNDETASKLDEEYEKPRKVSKPKYESEEVQSYQSPNSFVLGKRTLIEPISTRLKRFTPKFKKLLRDFDFNSANKTQNRLNNVLAFAEKWKKLDPEIRENLDLALKNADGDEILKLITQLDLIEEYNSVRIVLEDLYSEAEDSGMEIGYIPDYFPRKIIPSEVGKVRNILYGVPEFRSLIDEELSKARETKGSYLNAEEEADVINSVIQGFRPRGVATPGSAKPRTIPIVTKEINQYYYDPITSLVQYIQGMTETIEQRNVFGKGTTEDSIGEFVLKLRNDGVIKPEAEEELIQILRARFNNTAVPPNIQTMKDVGYALTMATGYSSAVTQIGDLSWALHNTGASLTMKNMFKSAFNMSDVKLKDIAMDRISAEFDIDESQVRLSSKVLRKLFGLNFLTKMDRIGKETLINATLDRYRALARNKKGFIDASGTKSLLLERMEQYFDGDIDEVLEDLRGDKITENIKVLVFNTLADHQPITLSEMPVKYNEMAGGRIFYMLKSFTIKQLDVFRNIHFDKINNGKTAYERMQGRLGILRLATYFMLANAGADRIKDWMMGRPVNFDDYVIDGLMRLLGFSKYNVWEYRRDGIVSATTNFLLGPVKSVPEKIIRDIKGIKEQGDLPTTTPLIGKGYNWYFGRGAEYKSKDVKEMIEKKMKTGLPITLDDKSEYLEAISHLKSRGKIKLETYEKKLDKLQNYEY